MRIKLKDLIFHLCVLLFVFQDPIQYKIFHYFSYWDEIAALFGVFIILGGIFKFRANVLDLKLSKYVLIFAGLLIISTVLHKFQPIKSSLIDLFLLLKFFLAIVVGKNLTLKFNRKRLEKNIVVDAKIVTFILTFFTILSPFIPDYILHDRSFGVINTLVLFYSHPLCIISNCIMCLSVFLWSRRNINWSWIVMNLILCFLTLRTKAFAAILIFILLLYMSCYKVNKKVISVLIIFGVIIISYDQVMFYFVNNPDFARAKLLTTSLKIAKDFFPFGSGLATFGSHESAVVYSPVYELYKINNVWGLSKEMSLYISDNFWPMVIGEGGVLAALVYVKCIIILFLRIPKKITKKERSASIFLLLYLLVASTNESAFANPYSVPVGILIGMYSISSVDIENSK